MGMNEFESYNKRANLWFYDAQRSDVTNFSHYKKKLKLGCMIFKFFSSSQVTNLFCCMRTQFKLQSECCWRVSLSFNFRETLHFYRQLPERTQKAPASCIRVNFKTTLRRENPVLLTICDSWNSKLICDP